MGRHRRLSIPRVKLMQTVLVLIGLLILFRVSMKKFWEPKEKSIGLAEDQKAENMMPEDQFWAIIARARNLGRGSYMSVCTSLTNSLEDLPADEIERFDRTFSCLMENAYDFKLWEAAYALNGGCSDDMFEYFRSWLIGQGKNRYYRALRAPRSLFFFGTKELVENYEGLAYCAANAYSQKTGKEIPLADDIPSRDPGTAFDEGAAILKYPDLALLAW
jgi:hypothetical protein